MFIPWHCWGAIGNSFNDFTGERLSIDYTDGVDSRFAEELWLAPLVSTIDCDAFAGTTIATQHIVDSGGMNATAFLYANRGTIPAKIRLSDYTVDTAHGMTFTATPTDFLKTRSANGTEMISVAIGDGAAFRNITAVANFGAGDTESANNESYRALKFGEAFPAHTIASLGRGAGSISNVVGSNELTGSVTMDASAFATKSTITGDFVFTGFVLDGDRWIPLTDRGPVYLDQNFEEFRFLMPDMGRSSFNGFAYRYSQYFGALYSTATGLRFMKTIYEGHSIGPDRISRNTSPVQGPITGLAGDGIWEYANVYNPTTTDTYLCAFRPRQDGAWFTDAGMPEWYVLHKYAGNVRSNCVVNIDTRAGVLTNPHLFMGHDTDVAYIIKGRTPRWTDDSNYRFASSGTAYLTELRANPGKTFRVKRVLVETASCTSARTVTVQLSFNGETTAQWGAAITGNGRRWIDVPDGGHLGHRVKPSLVLATNASTASPRTVGEIVLDVDEEDYSDAY